MMCYRGEAGANAGALASALREALSSTLVSGKCDPKKEQAEAYRVSESVMVCRHNVCDNECKWLSSRFLATMAIYALG